MKHFVNLLGAFLLTIALCLLLFAFSFLITSVRASDFKLIELNEATIDYKNYEMINPNSRNMLLYPEKPKESLNVIVNIDVLKYAYWFNTVESLTTSAQYRAIGLETRLGLRLLPQVDISIYHHSQHLLERNHTYIAGFPEEDAVELKIYLYKKNREESLIGW